MIIKCLNYDDIFIDNINCLNDIYIILNNKFDIKNNKSLILICENTIINENNLNKYIDKEVYLYINRHINKNNIFNLLENIINISIINNDNNLELLIEMGFDNDISNILLEDNNNNLEEIINNLFN
tara:strand:+ start:85 stop:462 length:378 start_codon:yes stop_codon:yes gene_type:complete